MLSYTTNLGVYAVALAGAIVLTLKSGIFIPLYSAHVINVNKLTFIKPVLTGFILTLLLFLCSYSFSHFVSIHSWRMLIIYSVMMSLPFIPIIWFYIIDKKERDTLKSIVVSSIGNRVSGIINNEQSTMNTE
jgi:membrane protein EpsK